MYLPQLVLSQLHQNEKMLGRVFDGLEDEELDFRPVPTAFSFREHVTHLCAACEALIALREGRHFDWDTFEAKGTTLQEMLSQFRSLRLKAIPLVEDITPEAAELLTDYLVLHEAYHVGQLSLTRHCLHPEWDSLSLYA
jgi:uncharacterized damage-inducible protein DinB